MNTPVKIIVYLLLCALGFFSAALMLTLALQWGIVDALPPDDQLERFKTIYMGGGLLVSIVGISLGLISFFTVPPVSRYMLGLPVILPVIYGIAVLAYFARF